MSKYKEAEMEVWYRKMVEKKAMVPVEICESEDEEAMADWIRENVDYNAEEVTSYYFPEETKDGAVKPSIGGSHPDNVTDDHAAA